MQIRKRPHSNQKLNPDLSTTDVIFFNETINESEDLPTFFKAQPCDKTEDNYLNSYFATPGECTRSKTIKSLKLNPFDLSSPPSKIAHHHSFFSSTPYYQHSLPSKSNTWNYPDFCNENSRDSGFETDSIAESILSFATRSNDEDTQSSFSTVSDASMSTNSQHMLSKLKPTSSPVNNCSATGYLLPIVTDSSNNNVLIPQISGLTLANMLSGNHTLDSNLTILDCRFPYEYAGGHIANSINVYTCQKLVQTLFPVKESCSDRKLEEDISNLSKKLKRDNSIYVFYCEFSSYRAPKLAQCLRGLDRLAHFGGRDLSIPNIYVLFGGYRDFFHEYPQFCNPDAYVSMKQTRYPLRNSLYLSEYESKLCPENFKIKYRKEEKLYFREVLESEKKLRFLITKSTKDSDILQLFLSHPVIGGS